MITSWHDLEDWIRQYNLSKWTVSRTDPNRRSEGVCDKIVDTGLFKDKSFEEKLDFTHRSIELFGDRCYIQGFTSNESTKATVWNEICFAAQTPAAPAIGLVPQPTVGTVDEAAITDRIRKELQMDFDRREYERQRKELDEERALFNEQKNGVLGAVVGYLAPYLPAINKAMSMRQVAGLDANEDIEAARINPVTPEHDTTDTRTIHEESQEGDAGDDVFTDEESEQLFALMARFKAVEPDYLRLIESVVKMAESGDATYTMAKGFLLK